MIQNALRKRHDGEAGFTLIELLIVIIILGVLSAIVVFAVGGVSDRGDQAACKAELKTVETALEAYYAKQSSYPTSLDQVTGGTTRFLRSSNTKYWTTTGGGDIQAKIALPAGCTL